MSGGEQLPAVRVDLSRARAAPADWFVGDAQSLPLASTADFDVAAVRFATGARNRPHVHDRDQYLHFVEGRGFVHVAGAEEQVVEPGTVVVVPAGVVHMHGATDAGPCVHIAVRPPGTDTDWEPDGVPEDWARWMR